MTEGETSEAAALLPEQHFTEPPPRYNEATLVKRLEADGVGRPSTYASILSTIQEREYVKKEGGRFIPTELGMVVTDLLLESFDDIFDVRYTARMEEELDEIEEGKIDWRVAMAEFYERFDKDLKHAEEHMTDIKRMEKPTDLIVREVRPAPGHQVGQATAASSPAPAIPISPPASADGDIESYTEGYRQAAGTRLRKDSDERSAKIKARHEVRPGQTGKR